MNLEDLIRETKPQYIPVDKEEMTKNVFKAIRNQTECTRKYKSSWLKRGGAVAGITVLVMVGTFASGFVSPTMARMLSQIPLINAAYNLLENPELSPQGVRQAVTHGFDIKVNQVSSSNGITLTINNAYCASNEFAFDMVESFNSNVTERPVIRTNDMQMSINGTRKLYNLDGGTFTPTTDGKYAGIVHFDAHNMQPYSLLPNQFNLDICITKIGNITGQWNFVVPLSPKDVKDATKVFEPMITKTFNSITFTVQKVMVAPSEIEIDCELKQPLTIIDASTPHLKQLAAYDQAGNRLSGGIVAISKAQRNGNSNIIKITAKYTPPTEPLSNLTVKPDGGLNGLSIPFALH